MDAVISVFTMIDITN